MTPYNSRWLGGFVLALMLGPSGVQAQAARSFEELQQVLKVDEVVVVTDATGDLSNCSSVSPASLQDTIFAASLP